MLVEYKQNPTPDEARFLREAQWVVGTSKGPGWEIIKRRMAEMVQQCRDICDNCESSDEKVIAAFSLRLKLTRAITRDIINWVESAEAGYKRIVEELSTEPDLTSEIPFKGDMFATEEIDEYSTAKH